MKDQSWCGGSFANPSSPKRALQSLANFGFGTLERFQAKACPGLDPGWTPVRVKKVKTELGSDQSEPTR
jgi:hypothetical protein